MLFLSPATGVGTALARSSLVRPLGGPELAGVCSAFFEPFPDVFELERRGVPGRDAGRAAANALSSARGSSSSAAGLAALGARVVAGLAAVEEGEAEGMSSNWANSSSSVSAFLDAMLEGGEARGGPATRGVRDVVCY